MGVVDDLVRDLPPGMVTVAAESLEAYRHDAAALCTAGVPVAAVRPTTTAQVQQVLQIAAAHRAPVVPQGARTGLAGGANAVDGCVVLSLERMDAIAEIDPVEQIAVVEPGVTNAALSKAVAAHGLFYPPDPSSWEQSTIGGNIATNAGGLCCVKYGVTKDFVRGLEVVLASGEVMRTGRRTAKGVAGYDLTSLFVGSEGTLGVITEATLALRTAPGPAVTVAAVFPTAAAAMVAVASIMASPISPSLLEFLDGVTIEALRAYRDLGFPTATQAVLLAQSDSGVDPAGEVALLSGICTAAGALDVAAASDQVESAALLAARRMVLPALERQGVVLIDDIAVPRSRLVEFVAGVQAIAAEHDVLIACPGHAGDGNMHPSVVFPPDDPGARDLAWRAFSDITALGLRLGGTITGEHGVGQLKPDWLRLEIGAVGHRVQSDIKAALDPAGILNPGKVLGPQAGLRVTPQ